MEKPARSRKKRHTRKTRSGLVELTRQIQRRCTATHPLRAEIILVGGLSGMAGIKTP
jgi:hypothetical protein